MNNLYETDKQFIERLKYFVDEVENEENQQLDDETRYLAVLSVLIGSQGLDVFKYVLKEALNKNALSPIMVKETVYQATAYMGIGRAFPFIEATNDVLQEIGIELPLSEQGTTTIENRREKGTEAQVDIFGDNMKDFWQKGHINRWLAANCFGDYYTRIGLDYKQREMITFCFLAGQGGCEPQLVSHAAGNMNVGNDKAFLIRVVSQCVPYIGYPRSLNALSCIEKASEGK